MIMHTLQAKAAFVLFAALSLSGCVAIPMGAHTASMEALDSIGKNNLPAMAVGPFALAPGLPASMDQPTNVRAATLSSPDNGSFAQYLQKALETDLRAAGKLDPNSDLVISGLMTDNQVDSTIGNASASLGAKFTLTRHGQSVFEKSLSVSDHWDAAFVGAEAIPDAINRYTSLYNKLVVELLNDQDFEAAAKK